ncbi:hypothetical protein ACFU53_02665 [Streptomyces sp. NPDC057474]|uniref:hypothetical protein n=1 Tax=Streptomyces sp. NPDC057474 TaxID=3346144 RepID=UPI0036C23788
MNSVRTNGCYGSGEAAGPAGRHVVVVGGSLAGLLAARALVGHAERMTIVERDRFSKGEATPCLRPRPA